MNGSAATRQVSSSLSAISRAVANSIPRPIVNIRPTDANGSAIARACASSVGRACSSRSAVARIPAAISSPRPAAWAAKSASAATWFEYVLVAATERSGPAASGRATSAASASSESMSLVTASANAPSRRARVTYSITSGVRPDCESASTVDPCMSMCVS